MPSAQPGAVATVTWTKTLLAHHVSEAETDAFQLEWVISAVTAAPGAVDSTTKALAALCGRQHPQSAVAEYAERLLASAAPQRDYAPALSGAAGSGSKRTPDLSQLLVKGCVYSRGDSALKRTASNPLM